MSESKRATIARVVGLLLVASVIAGGLTFSATSSHCFLARFSSLLIAFATFCSVFAVGFVTGLHSLLIDQGWLLKALPWSSLEESAGKAENTARDVAEKAFRLLYEPPFVPVWILPLWKYAVGTFVPVDLLSVVTRENEKHTERPLSHAILVVVSGQLLRFRKALAFVCIVVLGGLGFVRFVTRC